MAVAQRRGPRPGRGTSVGAPRLSQRHFAEHVPDKRRTRGSEDESPPAGRGYVAYPVFCDVPHVMVREMFAGVAMRDEKKLLKRLRAPGGLVPPHVAVVFYNPLALVRLEPGVSADQTRVVLRSFDEAGEKFRYAGPVDAEPTAAPDLLLATSIVEPEWLVLDAFFVRLWVGSASVAFEGMDQPSVQPRFRLALRLVLGALQEGLEATPHPGAGWVLEKLQQRTASVLGEFWALGPPDS